MQETYNKILRVRKKLTDWFNCISTNPMFSNSEVIEELMEIRGYTSPHIAEVMRKKLQDEGLFRIESLTLSQYFYPLKDEELLETGIVHKGRSGESTFLLGGRYCLPIRDTMGNVQAIVSYFPDNRKYVTTSTFGFSKATTFYGIEHKEYYTAPYVCVVEGIYDTVCCQAFGISALGNMGLDMSAYKTEILSRYQRIIAIPDNDKAGRTASPFHTTGRNNVWVIKNKHSFVEMPSTRGITFKDMDELLKRVPCAEAIKAEFNKSNGIIIRL